jgi:hypothetical protein
MRIRHMCISSWIPKATNTHKLCNNPCFSTATMVARKRLNVMLYVHCLSCYSIKLCYHYCDVGLRLAVTVVCKLRYTKLFPVHRRCLRLFHAEKQYVPTVTLTILISLQFNLHYLFEEFLISHLQLLSRSLTNFTVSACILIHYI